MHQETTDMSTKRQSKGKQATAGTSKPWRELIKIHPEADKYPLWKDTDPERLREMSEDIRKHGLKEPITIRDKGDHWSNPDYELLDGRNRMDAIEMFRRFTVEDFQPVKVKHRRGGHPDPFYFRLTIKGEEDGDECRIFRCEDYLDDGQALEHIRSMNLLRRHDTLEEQRARREDFIKAHADWSSRKIAEELKVDHKTVEKDRLRIAAAATGDTSPVDTSKAVATGEGSPVDASKAVATGDTSPVDPPKRTGKDGKARKQPAKKKKLPSDWLPKPLPDCPLCEGKGSRRVKTYTACGSPFLGGGPFTIPCECVHDNPRPTIDELKAVAATEAEHASQQPASEVECAQTPEEAVQDALNASPGARKRKPRPPTAAMKVIAAADALDRMVNWWEQEPCDIAAQMAEHFSPEQIAAICAKACDLKKAAQAAKAA
jgi:hypothetical protein